MTDILATNRESYPARTKVRVGDLRRVVRSPFRVFIAFGLLPSNVFHILLTWADYA